MRKLKRAKEVWGRCARRACSNLPLSVRIPQGHVGALVVPARLSYLPPTRLAPAPVFSCALVAAGLHAFLASVVRCYQLGLHDLSPRERGSGARRHQGDGAVFDHGDRQYGAWGRSREQGSRQQPRHSRQNADASTRQFSLQLRCVSGVQGAHASRSLAVCRCLTRCGCPVPCSPSHTTFLSCLQITTSTRRQSLPKSRPPPKSPVSAESLSPRPLPPLSPL